MLELKQFKQLKDLNELKSHQTPKFIVVPEDLKAQISFKTLLSESTWSDVRDFMSVMLVCKDQSIDHTHTNEFDLIDFEDILNVAMIDYDDEEQEEFIFTFENKKALKNFLDEEDYRISDAVYLELDDQMIEELEAKTREAQLRYYDQKIAKVKLDIKLATKALEKYEELKEGLMNESK